MAVAAERRCIVDEDVIELPGPRRRVVDLVRLVEQPDGGVDAGEAAPPALHETPAVHDEQQVGAKAFDLLRKLPVVPVGVIGGEAERLRGLAQASIEHRATRQEAIVHAEDAAQGRLRVGLASQQRRFVCAAFVQPLRQPGARQRREPARRAQVHELDAVGAAGLGERAVLAVDPHELPGESVAPGRAEKMAVVEVHADQPDARRAQVARQVHRHVRRVVRVVQAARIAALGAGAPAEPEAHRARMIELELREHRLRQRSLHVRIAVGRELAALVDHDEVVRREEPAHIVDADRQDAVWTLQLPQRVAAAAHDDGRAAVAIAVLLEAIGQRRGGSVHRRSVVWRGGAHVEFGDVNT